MKSVIIALWVGALVCYAAAAYLTVMILLASMPYSKEAGRVVGVLFAFGAGFTYASALALQSHREGNKAKPNERRLNL